MIGQSISHYNILERLGESGSITVYKALDTQLKRLVILKFIEGSKEADPDFKKAFLEEIRSISALEHPNIQKIYLVGENDIGNLFVAVAFHPGETVSYKIDQAIRTGTLPFSVQEIIRIAMKISAGLTRSHEAGIVHGRINPGNILLTDRGEVKILDFGLSAWKDPNTNKDPDTDIVALGTTLAEMIRFLDRSSIPPLLDQIIRLSLSKSKTKHYTYAEEMHRDLTAVYDQLTRSSHPRRLPSRLQRPTRRLSPWVTTLMASLIVVGGWILFTRLQSTGEQKRENDALISRRNQNSLAILYFHNQTGDPRLNYLEKTITHLLTSSLSQSKYIRILPADKLLDIYNELQGEAQYPYTQKFIQKVAKLGNVSQILDGSIFKSGKSFRVSALLRLPRNGETVSLESNGFGEESVFSISDDLEAKIRSQLRLTGKETADDFHEPVAKISTFSPESMKYFVEGKEYYFRSQFQKAIAEFSQALKLDSDFALAHWYTYLCYLYLDQYSEAQKSLDHSLRLLHRISFRDQCLVRGFTAFHRDNDTQEAIRQYRQVLELYPDDEQALLNLGSLHRNREEWNDALQQFALLRRIHPFSQTAFQNEVFILGAMGDIERACDMLKNTPGFEPDDPVMRELSIQLNICRYKFEDALDVATRLPEESEDPQILQFRGLIQLFQNQSQNAESLFTKLLYSSRDEVRLAALQGLAQLHLEQYRFQIYEKETNQILNMARGQKRSRIYQRTLSSLFFYYYRRSNRTLTRSILNRIQSDLSFNFGIEFRTENLHLIGIQLVNEGNILEAERIASELQIISNRYGGKPILRRLSHLRGVIQQAKGNWKSAADLFHQAVQTLPGQGIRQGDHPFYHHSLAEVLFENDKIPEAQKEWEAISRLTLGRREWGDIYTKSFYCLGKISLQAGNPASAARYFVEFLQRTARADPGVPEVSEARHLLFRLQEK